MLNSILEALPSEIRAKSLAYAVAVAQNDPQKPRTRDISFGGYWPRPRGKISIRNIKYKGVQLSASCQHALLQIKWDGFVDTVW